MILLIITISLFGIYTFLILYYWQSWRSIPVFIPGNVNASINISVIIPARNEENHIGVLLASLEKQTYPRELIEVIVVDDQSTDRTADIVRQFPSARLIRLKEENINSYKKKAIAAGVETATGELIVTTDADCIPGIDWLKTIAAYKKKKGSVFIAAPVMFNSDSSVLQLFQSLDFLALQGITGAGVHQNHLSMCNGANIAYERSAFLSVNGFEGIDHIASGDDMLLMHKIGKRFPSGIHYLKSREAIVSTEPMKTWKDFFNQRIRWASKARQYDDKRISAVLLLVYIFNLSFLALFAAAFLYPVYWYWLGGLWLVKTVIEFPFIYSVASFFNKQWMTRYFFFLQPLHIIYTILAGLLGQFGRYEWKGRKVK